MSVQPGYAPISPADAKPDQIGIAIRLLQQGKSNAVATLTLTANSATTVWTDPRLTVNSFVDFDPMSANASADKAAGQPYALEANRNNKTWTLTHANTAATDRKFRVLIIG